MDQISLAAHAKVNLSLDILGTRPDGYHEVRMVMQPISLHDTVTLTRAASGISLTCDVPAVPAGPDNLAYRAAAHFFSHFSIKGGVRIHIQKRIPMAAGLAGGSADAAAVLRGMDALFGTHAPDSTLQALALPLGADVPFCLAGRPALAEGIGERLSPAPPLSGCKLVLINPGIPISTPAVYRAYDDAPASVHPDTAALLDALRREDLSAVCANMGNVLEPVTSHMCPAVPACIDTLRDAGALCAMMSGSGPTVFGVFPPDAKPNLSLPAHAGYVCCEVTCLPHGMDTAANASK